MGEIDGYRYSFCVYGGHKYVVQLPVGFDLEGHQALPRGVLAPLPPCLPVRVCYNPLGISCGER